VKNAIDGTPNNSRGWAVSPVPGITHWATFEAKEALGYEGGTILTFTLRQTYDQPDYMLSRFWLSVAIENFGLSLSDELGRSSRSKADQRTASEGVPGRFTADRSRAEEEAGAVATRRSRCRSIRA
jgi:hypothetical protein